MTEMHQRSLKPFRFFEMMRPYSTEISVTIEKLINLRNKEESLPFPEQIAG